MWYYVQTGERRGPVELDDIFELLKSNQINDQDYVWRKGLDNWMKVYEMTEFSHILDEVETVDVIPEIVKKTETEQESNRLRDFAGSESSIFIKIGADRGAQEVEYGPYSLDLIKKLFIENRINAKTFVFAKGMKNWQLLADFDDFESIFSDVPPPIKDEDRRGAKRKPFIARMYIQSKKIVFVGICRDISIGGMQVLVDNFPGTVGERIAINVHPENTEYHFVASGNIVRMLDGGQGFSFRFVDLSEESSNAIKKYINEAG